MIMCRLSSDNGLFNGHVEWGYNSYVTRVFRTDTGSCVQYKSFGNGVSAENFLLDWLEYEAWTLLKT